MITGVRATPVYVPMRHPLRWSFGVEPGLTRVIVEVLTDEGLVGLGESNGGRDLAAAVAFADASPFPDPKDLLNDMFAAPAG
jgi:L-alanine-DL-glutamate epimerase-like enolase superfamily enzyme